MADNSGNPDRAKLLRFTVFFGGMILMLIWGFYKTQSESAHLSEVINSGLFNIPNVSTNFVEFRERGSEVNLTIKSEGLPKPATHYKTQLLSFVCNDKVLKNYLAENLIIYVNMTAYDRENGKNVNLNVSRARCEYDT